MLHFNFFIVGFHFFPSKTSISIFLIVLIQKIRVTTESCRLKFLLYVAFTHKIFSKAAVKRGSGVIFFTFGRWRTSIRYFSRDTQPSFSPISGEYFSFFPYCLESNNSSYFVVKKNQKSTKKYVSFSSF